MRIVPWTQLLEHFFLRSDAPLSQGFFSHSIDPGSDCRVNKAEGEKVFASPKMH